MPSVRLTRDLRRKRPGRARLGATAAAGALALAGLVAASPAAAETCKFAPVNEIDRGAGVEPQLLIDGDCVDPDYNESTFVVDKTEQLTFQVPERRVVLLGESLALLELAASLERLELAIAAQAAFQASLEALRVRAQRVEVEHLASAAMLADAVARQLFAEALRELGQAPVFLERSELCQRARHLLTQYLVITRQKLRQRARRAVRLGLTQGFGAHADQERILESEEEHIDFLETQFEMIKRMGLENYIQLQSKPAED